MNVVWLFGALMVFVVRGSHSAPSNATDHYTVVTTNYGDLRGIVYSLNQVSLVKFLGIPYAQPPVGQWRFKPPQPPVSWSGVKDAIALGNECLQTSMPLLTPVKGLTLDEDCLFLSVYAPAMINTTTSLPVMVWIHGGAYIFGGGSQYDGSDLAALGVVVVTINYRLEAFGFLSSETDEMPGNYGMLDQIQALRWVKENIAAFGGDPNQVTIFGESAGAASVSLLTLSPLSKGLFTRAIMESGVSLTPWAIRHPASRVSPSMFTRLVAGTVGCLNFEPAALLTCLQNVDAGALHNASVGIAYTLDAGLVLAPRVENVTGFLPDLPIHLLSRGEFHHVDSLRGFNADETGGDVPDATNQGYTLDVFKNFLSTTVFGQYGFTDVDQLVQEIIDIYIGNATDPFFIRAQAIQATTDINFRGPAVYEIGLFQKSAPMNKHYLYEFEYRPSYSFSAPWQGTVHADEVPFVFGVDNVAYKSFGVPVTDTDRGVSKQMLIMWTNFAKTGDPSSSLPVGAETWQQYTSGSQNYLNIDITSKVFSYNHPEVINLCQEIIQKLDTSFGLPDGVIVG